MRIYVNGTMVEVTGKQGPAGPDGNPIGTVISFMGSAAPEDYLACDGRVHNIAEYPDLVEFFRKQFGAANHFGGDGETNFAVPTVQGTEAGMLSCIKARTSAVAEDVYSLEERIVGRWIDGKPVYKRAFTGTAGVSTPVDVSSWNIDTVIDITGTVGSIATRYVHKLSSYTPARDGQYGCYIFDSKFFVEPLSKFLATSPYVATLKYTKTTDQPTIPLPEAETNILQEDWSDAAEDEIVNEEI